MSFNIKLVSILTFFLLLLLFRFFQVYTQPKPPVGIEIKLVGKVAQEPVILGQSQYFEIKNFKIRTKIFPKYYYGDFLEIAGTPDKNLLISYPEIAKVGEKKDLFSAILAFRRFLIAKAAQLWPQPEAALLTGVILGQDAISANFRQALINTGTIHIVVVSGQNVAMIAAFITSAFSKIFKRKQVSILLIVAVVFYTVLTGFQPPTIRAGVMGILAFLARLTGRENWGFWALGTAVYLMLISDPQLLLNISFQLSVAATFGILFVEPIISTIFGNFPKIAKESLSVTVAAWIFTAPLIAFYFTQFTPITPFSNLLVLPVVPFLMIWGALSLAVSGVSLFLGRILAIVPFIPASYFTIVVENLAKIPFAGLKLPQFNIYILFAFYLFVFVIISWLKKHLLAEN